MHDDTPGALISINGHTLTAAEGHAFIFGCIGYVLGAIDEIDHAIRKEPHYFLAGLLLSYGVGRVVSRFF